MGFSVAKVIFSKSHDTLPGPKTHNPRKPEFSSEYRAEKQSRIYQPWCRADAKRRQREWTQYRKEFSPCRSHTHAVYACSPLRETTSVDDQSKTKRSVSSKGPSEKPFPCPRLLGRIFLRQALLRSAKPYHCETLLHSMESIEDIAQHRVLWYPIDPPGRGTFRTARSQVPEISRKKLCSLCLEKDKQRTKARKERMYIERLSKAGIFVEESVRRVMKAEFRKFEWISDDDTIDHAGDSSSACRKDNMWRKLMHRASNSRLWPTLTAKPVRRGFNGHSGYKRALGK